MPNPRKVSDALMLVTGFLVGVVSYVLAEALTPHHAKDPLEHQFLLNQYLVLIYAPLTGVWLGWLQKSWRRALLGVAIGVDVGILFLCAESRIILFTFPVSIGLSILLGGVLAVVLGSNHQDWRRKFIRRLVKGGVAGFLFAFIYLAVLLLFPGRMLLDSFMDAPPAEFVRKYYAVMRIAGPLALGTASMLFFPLIARATSLHDAELSPDEEPAG